MCGIVGYITLADDTIEHSKDKFFTEALFTDTLRGMDSTGIMTLEDEFHWQYQKQAIPAPEFIQEKGYWERETKTWCSVGHNRAATVGKITTDNAHPFKQGKILLVHNGTLRSTYDLPFKKKGIIVDSELIAYNLSKVEPEEAHEILTKLQGAYALVWFDERDQSVNLARNTERPFHISVNKDEDALFFSSDGHLLNFVGRRMGNVNARPNNIWQMGAGQHLKYKKGSLVPEVTKVLPFTRPIIHQGNHYPSGRHHSGSTGSSDRIMPMGRAGEIGKTMIAGTIRSIPACHTDMLQWYMMAPDMEFLFEPQEYLPWGNKPKGHIYGRMWHPEWEAWINARVEGTFLSMGNYGGPWTVVPIGCDHTSLHGNEKDELTIIGKLKLYIWKGDLPEGEGQKIEVVSGYDLDTDMCRGPRGDITVEAFQLLVKDGCAMCADPVFINEAEDICWVGEMQNQPLCEQCIHDSLEKGGEVPDVYNKD